MSLLAQREAVQGILEDFPELEPEDIRACIAYAYAGIAQDLVGGGTRAKMML